jgi:hypothetical protein
LVLDGDESSGFTMQITILGDCPRKTRPALSAIVAVGEA